MALALLLSAASVAPSDVAAGVNTWTALGPEGGRVHDVELSLSAPGVLYLITSSGFHRSTLAGATWELTKEDFGSYPLDVAVDPTSADRVLVAAGNGVWLSTDRGTTFTRRFGPNGGVRVEMSRDGATAYLAEGAHIYRSQNRGDTWTARTSVPASVNALEIDPSSPDVLYASNYFQGIFASQDGGATWQSLGSPTESWNFVVDPANPQRLLAATGRGLFISDNRGLAWLPTTMTASVSDVDVDPVDSMTIYVGHLDGKVSRTTDGGATWTTLPVNLDPFGIPNVVIDPTQSANIVTYGGDAAMISTDFGATFAKRSAGIYASAPHSLSTVGGRNYFALAAGGVYYVEAGGATSHAVNNAALAQLQPSPVSGVRVFGLPSTAADMLYAILSSRVIAKSIDSGVSWSSIWDDPAISVQKVAASVFEPQTLYAATSQGVYKSADAGVNWAPRNTGLPAGIFVQDVAVASMPAILYASGYTATPGSPPTHVHRIYRSGDAGASWQEASDPESGSLVPVVVDPRDPNVVYTILGRSGQLRKATNGDSNWTPLNGPNGAPLCCVRSIAFDPANPRVIYAGVAGPGPLRSVDGGVTWERLHANSPSQTFDVNSIATDPSNPSSLLIAVDGFGVRRMTISPDLELTMTAPSSLLLGNAAAYTLNLRNLGPFDATNVHVTVEFPAGASPVTATTPVGTCTTANRTVTCTYDFLRAGANAIAVALSTAPTVEGAFIVSASIDGDEPDPVGANDNRESTVNVSSPFASSASPAPSGGGGGGGGATSLEVLALLAAWLALARRRPALCSAVNRAA